MKPPVEHIPINKILLVDDDAAANYLSKELLEQLHTAKEIEIADNGLSAFEMIKQKNCADIIFLDIKMPGMDGFDFLEAFKIMGLPAKEKEHVNIIVVTSSDNQQDIDKARVMGASHYLTKPLSAESLKHALEYSE